MGVPAIDDAPIGARTSSPTTDLSVYIPQGVSFGGRRYASDASRQRAWRVLGGRGCDAPEHLVSYGQFRTSQCHRSRTCPHPDSRSDERGFTLVETIVAAAILMVALVALAELLAVSVRMHQIGRDSASAARLAQDKFEEMMKMNFFTNPAIQIGGGLDANTANHFDAPANSGYTRRWIVAAGPGANPRLRHRHGARRSPDVPGGLALRSHAGGSVMVTTPPRRQRLAGRRTRAFRSSSCWSRWSCRFWSWAAPR